MTSTTSASNITSNHLLKILLYSLPCFLSQASAKTCLGWPWYNNGETFHLPKNSSVLYKMHNSSYFGCKIITKNLLLMNLNEKMDLSFLSSIQQVEGHVFIKNVTVNKLDLSSLSVIRGYDLFENKLKKTRSWLLKNLFLF